VTYITQGNESGKVIVDKFIKGKQLT